MTLLPAFTPARWRAARAMLGLCLCGFLTYGIGVYGFTQFLVPISTEFTWGRTVVGGMMGAFWVAAPFTIVAAIATGRFGIRRVVLAGVALEVLGLVLATHADTPVGFYGCRFLMGAGKALAVTPVPIMAVAWFPRRPALAVAITLAAWHLGGLVFAPAAAALIAYSGWRTAADLLAATLGIGILISVATMRDPASDATRAAPTAVPPQAPAGIDARPAAHLAIALGTFAFYAGYSALLAQLSPLLADAGFSAADIGTAMGSVAIVAMLGCLASGYLAGRTRSDRAGSAMLLGIALVAFVATLLRAGAGMAPVYAVVVGAGLLVGAGDPVLIEALRRSVAQARFARAYGIWYLICLASLAAASVFAGAIYDALHSYRLAFLTICGTCAVAGAVWWRYVRVVFPAPVPRTT